MVNGEAILVTDGRRSESVSRRMIYSKGSMEWYEGEVHVLEEQRQAGRFPVNCPVFYGSSSIRLWSTLADDVDPTVLNLAFGGSTLDACVYFFDRIVSPVQPSALVLYGGDNDLGDGRSPEDVAASFRSLAAKVDLLPGSPQFGFISIKPSPARWGIVDRIRRANRYVAEEIGRHAGGFYIDVFPAMLDSDGLPRPELFEPDGLHISRAGYRLWAELLRPYRNRIVAKDSSQRKDNPVFSFQGESRIPQVVQPEPEP